MTIVRAIFLHVKLPMPSYEAYNDSTSPDSIDSVDEHSQIIMQPYPNISS